MILKMLDGLLNPPPPKFHGVMGIWYYVDDATDAVVRIGDPGNDPEYTEWPVPLDELGGEIDFDTILEEILSGESSSSSSEDEDSEDEDSDESTTTTEE